MTEVVLNGKYDLKWEKNKESEVAGSIKGLLNQLVVWLRQP